MRATASLATGALTHTHSLTLSLSHFQFQFHFHCLSLSLSLTLLLSIMTKVCPSQAEGLSSIDSILLLFTFVRVCVCPLKSQGSNWIVLFVLFTFCL